MCKCVSVSVTNFLNCYEMANKGWILEFKVSMEVSWQNTSIYFFNKKNWNFLPKKDPLKFFWIQNMSHGNGSSTLVSQLIWKWLTVYYSMDPGQHFLHKKLVGCHSLYGSNFDFLMTNFRRQHLWTKFLISKCKLLNKTQ